MAELNPPYALQNAGATHTAAGDRMMLAGLLSGIATGSQFRGGVSPTFGSEFVTSQTGSPSMQILVGSGICYVPGTQAGTQGVYACVNDSNVTLTVTTAHGTFSRIDTVVARVYDSLYSGVTDTWALEIIAGTPAASPTAPTLPANTLPLYNISVGAAVTSITNANLSDVRSWVNATGGVFVVRNQTERDAITGHPTTYAPLAIRTDTGVIEAKINGTWVPRSPQAKLVSTQSTIPSFTANGAWNTWPSISWAPIVFTMPPSGNITVSIGATLANNSTSAVTWAGFSISGGLTVTASSATAVAHAGALTGAFTREVYFTGGTPGAATTITPEYLTTTGSLPVISTGQLRVTREV